MRRVVLIGLAAAGLLAAGPPRVRLGGVSVNASYVRGPAFWGPGFWGPSYWGPGYWGPYWRAPLWSYYDPFWSRPWIHPAYYSGFAFGPGMGEVKLSSSSKEAVVLIDGAYAGEARKLKSMWLEPGVYNVQVRDDAGASFERRIYVLSGKTLQVRAELQRKGDSDK